MDPEIIDWGNIESEFVEEEEYENIDAPQWIDLSMPEELVDDEAWFCKSGCKHPTTAEDFLNSKSFKMKLLRSITISEFRPFRDKSRRGRLNLKQTEQSSASAKEEFIKSKRLSSNEILLSHNLQTDEENQNPNHSSKIPSFTKKTRKEAGNCSTAKKQMNGSTENPPANDHQKHPLKDTFSARNLLKGREILSQIMDLCTILKKKTNKRPKKEAGEKDLKVIPSETKKTTGERPPRRPLEAK